VTSQNYLEPVKQTVSDMQTGDSNLELHGFAEISETALCSLTLANDQLDGQTFLIQLLKSSTRTF
jgi:hypothetical protein